MIVLFILGRVRARELQVPSIVVILARGDRWYHGAVNVVIYIRVSIVEARMLAMPVVKLAT